ncbi:uncharacterized protein CTRU02_203744 [Colletotrichum truncatum]|uniref:Uncharacterized protein n=1 Tax=Colletotrichum truncatum TaxID=5467 RepID=A0ACC3ZA60_COLTU|nr:uncharacterized protein CTRU02_04077 [Colletotrichum truncatum]KAF6796116.1 hypothetical protein CTRU02_04077 [Colletotrichum truncatum]
MADTTPEDAAAQRAAEQARLRKAKREAKIRAGGTARLNKITGLGGGFQRDDPVPSPAPSSRTESPVPSASPAASQPKAATAEHADPEEIDISQHYYQPAATPRPSGPPIDPNSMSEDQLRQMMLGFDRPGPGAGGAPPMNPFAAAGGMPGGEEDPMMKMLSQMMAGAGGPGGGGFPGFPGAQGAGAGGFPAGFPGMQMPQQQADTSSAYLWRILHAIFAISLGLYIAFSTTFTGSKMEREHTALAYSYPVGSDEAVTDVNTMEKGREVFFWMFATAEAVLLTTRFFVDRGRAPPSGLVWTVVSFLPGNIKTYVETLLRYGQIFVTVRSDILVCVFVLGICSWVRG